MADSSWMQTLTTAQIVKLYYHETPNRDAAIAAIALFSAVTVLLVATTIKTRAWFMMAAVLTGAMEVAGYVLRVRMMSKPEFNTYVVSYAFLVIAPVFLAIVEYVCLSKLIHRANNGSSSTMFGKAVSGFMIVSEIACLGIQCASAGWLTSDDAAARNIGRIMMLSGLAAQIGFFTVFTVITLYVHLSARFGYNRNLHFKTLFGALYSTILLIYIRNIFRVSEFAQGFDGYLATHEEFFYGFDFTIVFCIMLVFGVLNYGFAFQSTDTRTSTETGAANGEKPAAGQKACFGCGGTAVPKVDIVSVEAV